MVCASAALDLPWAHTPSKARFSSMANYPGLLRRIPSQKPKAGETQTKGIVSLDPAKHGSTNCCVWNCFVSVGWGSFEGEVGERIGRKNIPVPHQNGRNESKRNVYRIDNNYCCSDLERKRNIQRIRSGLNALEILPGMRIQKTEPGWNGLTH